MPRVLEYTEGPPCKKCGDTRKTKQNKCPTCNSASNKDWRRRNPDKVRANEKRRGPRRIGTDARIQWSLKKLYKMSVEEYKRMFEAQNGLCDNCGKPEVAKRSNQQGIRHLSVDHDHACCPGNRSCGKCVRALLCYHCNAMIGMSYDNPEVLRGGADYIERHRAARKLRDDADLLNPQSDERELQSRTS